MVIAADPPSLAVDSHGVWRVGGTPVSFEVLIARYLQGCSAEEIAEGFPAVPLADVHWTISYYLRHREKCDEYLRRRRREDDEVEGRVRAEFDNESLRRRAQEYRARSESRP